MLNFPSMKYVLLINDKMPTIAGILTIISRVNTSSEANKYVFQVTWNFK